VATGPLLPGMREFDVPRSRRPAWLAWLLGGVGVVVVLVVLAGLVGGVGPLKVLGLSTTPLQPVGYRTTADPTAIDVAVTLPAGGLCRNDDVEVTAFERGNRVEVEGSVVRTRNATCATTSIGGDLRWVEVPLDAALGARTVIRTVDREPLPLMVR
jgi:hypothetical protein